MLGLPRLLVCVLVLCLCSAPSGGEAATQGGDANCDGRVDALDVVAGATALFESGATCARVDAN